MAEIELKNRIITVQDVIKVGEILNNHYTYLQQQFEESKIENEGKDFDEEFYRLSIGWGELKFSILRGDAKEDRNDFQWFKDTLTKDAKRISGVNIYYDCNYKQNCKKFDAQDNHEHFRLNLDNNLNYGYGSLEKEFPRNALSKTVSDQIDSIFQNCKPRFDKTLQHKTLYRVAPSFAISGILGIILSIVLLLSTKISFLPEKFVSFINSNPWIVGVSGIGIMIILGFILPNSNMAQFKRIQIDKQYDRYDANWQIEHYKNDYERFKNQTEFAVGRFYGGDQARENIQKNFKISAVISLISIVALIALTVAMYLI